MVLVKWGNNRTITLKVLCQSKLNPHIYEGQGRRYNEKYIFNDRDVLMISSYN